MKKFIGILSLLLVVLLSFSSFVMSASAAEFRDFYEVPEYFYGDVDFDGRVSVKDATALQKHLAKIIGLGEDALYFGDVDGNATAIQKYVAKMIDIFPVEEIFADYYCKADGEEVLVELKNEIGILIEITVEEAKNHPNKNVITRALGVDESIRIDYSQEVYNSGEIILLCTDGLTNYVEEDRILEICKVGDSYSLAELLVDEANKNGGGYNVPVVTVTD